MATITGFTAARMLAIENSTIVDGNIVGDDLVLLTRDGTPVNAGDVRGPVGPPGFPNPAGTFIMGGWATDPDGYWILDGRNVANGATNYPALAAMFPTWVSGNNLVLPNPISSVPLILGSDTADRGVVSGSMTHILTPENLATHVHTTGPHTHTSQDHSHILPAHQHQATGINTSGDGYPYRSRTGNTGYDVLSSGPSITLSWVLQPQSSTHPDLATGGANSGIGNSTNGQTASNTGPFGSNTAINHTPRNITVKMAVKY